MFQNPNACHKNCTAWYIKRPSIIQTVAMSLYQVKSWECLLRDTSSNAWNRHWGSFTVDTGILSNNMKFPLSQKLNDILWPDHIQWQPPADKTLYRTRTFTEFWVVSIENLRWVWHADRGRLLLRTPGPVPLGLAYVLLVETNPFPNLSLFDRNMLFEYPSVLSRFCFT